MSATRNTEITLQQLDADMPFTPIPDHISSNGIAPDSRDLVDLSLIDDLCLDESLYVNQQSQGFRESYAEPFTSHIDNSEIMVFPKEPKIDETIKVFEEMKHSKNSVVDALKSSSVSKVAIQVELSPKLFGFEGRSVRSRTSENFDFISLQLSSDDEIDYRSRFEAFFGIDYAVSSCTESINDSDFGYENTFAVDRINPINQEKVDQSVFFKAERNMTDVIPDTPPSYSEVTGNSTLSFKACDKENSTNACKLTSPMKIDKNNNQPKEASKDVYRLDKYLPPYRSLLNPNRVYDYRTNSFIDFANKHIVTVCNKNKKSNQIFSLMIKASTKIPQMVTWSNASSYDEASPVRYHTKPNATFHDLPEQIVNNIMGFLNQKDLVNTLYISKKMKRIAIPKLYYYPRFTSTYRVAQFVHTILNSSYLASLVKVLDFSKINFPVILTTEERNKYQNTLIYGIDSAIDILNCTNKTIYAGWRDWKFRDNTKYGASKRARSRSSSLSTLNSISTSIPSEIDVLPSNYFPELSGLKTTSYTNDKFKNKSRCNEGIILSSNLKLDEKSFMKNMKRIFDPWKKKSTERKPCGPARKKVKQNHIIQQKQTINIKRKQHNTVTFALEEAKCRTIPFSTPHPLMKPFLRQHCLKRDIPVGFLIHLFEECTNLEEINLDDTVISSDYKLCDYITFDWKYSTGVISRVPKQREGRSVFWSDTDRDIDVKQGLVENGIIEIMEIHKIWESLMSLKNIKILNLSRLNSIEKNQILRLLFESQFSTSIEKLVCNGSGMVKRTDWDVLENVSEWKSYLLAETNNQNDCIT